MKNGNLLHSKTTHQGKAYSEKATRLEERKTQPEIRWSLFSIYVEMDYSLQHQ